MSETSPLTDAHDGARAPAASVETPTPAMDEYGRRLASETRTSLEALQRSLAGVDGIVPAAPELPDNVEIRYGYRVGGVGLLHDVRQPVQLTELAKVYALPNTTAWCLGLANLRGNLTPVYDLAQVLGAARPARRNKLLVVGRDEDAAGIVIDDTPTQLRIAVDEQAADAPDVAEPLRAHVRRTFVHGGEPWIEPDYAGLFAALARGAEG